jgi:Fur family ferric uptake transcriptional regulator
MAKSYALSQPDIERGLGENFDRVTIYRTLTSFMDKGVIHKVPDDSGLAKYALCRQDCETHVHHDRHIHFKCNGCGNTSCLENFPFPDFKAPAGYVFTDTNVLIQGICPDCAV